MLLNSNISNLASTARRVDSAPEWKNRGPKILQKSHILTETILNIYVSERLRRSPVPITENLRPGIVRAGNQSIRQSHSILSLMYAALETSQHLQETGDWSEPSDESVISEWQFSARQFVRVFHHFRTYVKRRPHVRIRASELTSFGVSRVQIAFRQLWPALESNHQRALGTRIVSFQDFHIECKMRALSTKFGCKANPRHLCE